MLKVRKASLLEALTELRSQRLVHRATQGWILAAAPVQLALDERGRGAFALGPPPWGRPLARAGHGHRLQGSR